MNKERQKKLLAVFSSSLGRIKTFIHNTSDLYPDDVDESNAIMKQGYALIKEETAALDLVDDVVNPAEELAVVKVKLAAVESELREAKKVHKRCGEDLRFAQECEYKVKQKIKALQSALKGLEI